MVHGKADYLIASIWLTFVGIAVVYGLWSVTHSIVASVLTGLLFQGAALGLWLADIFES